MRKATAEERFWSFVYKDTDCWLWLGATRGNYGVFKLATGVQVYVHRFSLELKLGRKLLPNEEAHHDPTCKSKLCVRPDHLTAVFDVEHPDSITVINSKKTHCPKGHPYSGTESVGTHIARVCRICKNERAKLWMRKHYGYKQRSV